MNLVIFLISRNMWQYSDKVIFISLFLFNLNTYITELSNNFEAIAGMT